MNPTLTTLLDDIEAKAKAIIESHTPDCGDNSCRYAVKRGGMRTNGGCTCTSERSIMKSTPVEQYAARLASSSLTPPTTLALVSALRVAREALANISQDFVPEGTSGRDCPGCDYDNYINFKHHEECVYVVATEALTHLNELFGKGK